MDLEFSVNTQPRSEPVSTPPVQRLPETKGLGPGTKHRVAGKIKGRSTPVGRLRDLHGGLHGTQRRWARAAMMPKAAPLVAARCAVTAPARQTTPGNLA
jgi:hypothetical protein